MSCLASGHPLSASGTVDIRVDLATPLFAADQVDAGGKPSGLRQTPHATGVTLSLTEEGQPAWGAYVDVRVDPPQALVLSSDPSEKTPSCTAANGAFRCTGTDHGFARLLVSSEGQWSGAASLLVTWGGNAPKVQPITILPAGLPQDATGFALLVGGLDQTKHVLATYEALVCTMGPVPDDLGSAWRPGQIRARQATVTASPSPSEPGALPNAPVIVSALSAEGALALKADCSDRKPRLRVLLGPTGQSPPFFLCFSDNGGAINFSVTSGQKALDPQPQMLVEPEPRLLRVRSLLTQLPSGLTPIDLFEVSAYNADRVRIALPVDLTIADSTVLSLDVGSTTLADASSVATVLHATPLAIGTTTLHVSPSLFAMPDCVSPPVTVVAGMVGQGVINGCDPALTQVSAGNVTIQFPMGSTSQQYSPACVTIHQGAQVTWEGSFTNFPLKQGPEGTLDNPIVFTSAGTSATFTFPMPGSFGFQSSADPTGMQGAVFVVP
jgi:plastocyanin